MAHQIKPAVSTMTDADKHGLVSFGTRIQEAKGEGRACLFQKAFCSIYVSSLLLDTLQNFIFEFID